MASALAAEVLPQEATPGGSNQAADSPTGFGSATLVDLVAVASLVLLGLLGFRASYGGWAFLVVGALGLALGLAVGYLAAHLRMSSLLVSVVALVAVVIFAGVVALPQTTAFGFLPTVDTLVGLLRGFTSGWKDLVTIPPPVGNEGNLLAIPYLCGFLGGLLGVSGAVRSTRLWWGALPPVAVLAASIITGVTVPVSLLAQGAVFAVILLGWAALRERRLRSVYVPGRRFRGRGPMAVALLIVAGFVGLTFFQSVPGAHSRPRLLLRSYVQPDVDLAALPSPLSGIRRYFAPGPQGTLDAPMLTIDGLPAGSRVRVAVMDVWDGTAFGVAGARESSRSPSSGEFVRTGQSVPTTLQGQPVHLEVTIDDGYHDVWVPTVGGVKTFSSDNTRITSTFRYNIDTDTAVVTSGLGPGDHYSMDVVIPPTPAEAALKAAHEAAITQPYNAEPPKSMGKVLSDLLSGAPASGPYERATAIAVGLSKGYYSAYSGSQSRPPGHGEYRLDYFFEGAVLAGDAEQYGAAAALMAREVGVPTRLVMGFQGPPNPAGGPVTLRGRDMTVWLEVDLDGLGWVPVTGITPPRDRLPKQDLQRTTKPKPQVQPPPVPQPQVTIPPADQVQTPSTPQDQTTHGAFLPAWIVKLGVYVGVPMLLVWAAIAVIVGAKARRSRRRRNDPNRSRAVTGGWTDLLDRARDGGYESSMLWTRSETARELGTVATAVTHHLPALAGRADAAAFGPGMPSADDVAAYWADVATAERALLGSLGRWRRLRARLSLRSLGLRDLVPDLPSRGGAAAGPRPSASEDAG